MESMEIPAAINNRNRIWFPLELVAARRDPPSELISEDSTGELIVHENVRNVVPGSKQEKMQEE